MKASHLALAAIIAAVIVAGTAVAVYKAENNTHPIGIRLGIEFNTHATAAWIALSEHLFSQHGLRIEKVIKFRTGPELAAAFAHGDIDAAWACLAPIIKMIDKGAKLYIVEAAHYYGYGCVGSPRVKSIEDLKKLGREPVIAIPGKGAQVYPMLLLAEKKYGFHAKIVYIKPPAILSAVLKGSVDAACIPEPLLSVALSKGLHLLFMAQQVWPNMPGSYLVVSQRLLKEQPEAVCKLAEVNEEATSLIYKDPGKAVSIDAKMLGLPASVINESLKHLYFTTRLNVAEMQKMVDIMYEHGLVRHDINISKYIVNLSKLCGKHG